ncbi:MAG: PQQ-dependent sugar dehydrogenase [Acidobacteria bacterium]|nr:PQQ-dependent sugar dehydrogenase [Acidobacteriota bacterium]
MPNTARRLARRRSHPALALTATLAILGATSTAPTAQTPTAGQVFRTSQHDFRLEVVAMLQHPHSMAFTPEGDMLITERPGRLRIVRQGTLLPAPVAGLPDVLFLGNGATSQDGREQAGLRDVVLHPLFATNRLLYLSYVKPGPNGYGNLAVARGRFENDRLSNVQEIFVANAPGNGTNRSSMWGGRIAFDKDGYLFITLGDRQWPAVPELNRHPAQDLLTHNGKTVRLHDDGRVPKDNPFVGTPHALPEIWTLGHRNAQGMAFNPATGDLWQNEHGPQGGDELNMIVPGMNYGWPVVGYGVNYTTGLAIHEGTHKDGFTPPAHVWVPSIGVSGMIFYAGDRFSGWKGNMLVGGMSGQRLARLVLSGRRVVADEILIQGMGRMRDVQQGPDGSIYVMIDANVRGVDGEATPVYRLAPVERTSTSARR